MEMRNNFYSDINNNLEDDLLDQRNVTAAALLGGVKVSQHWMAFFDFLLNAKLDEVFNVSASEGSEIESDTEESDEEITDIGRESDYSESEEDEPAPQEKTVKQRARTPWSTAEDKTLKKEFKRNGCKWTKIQDELPNKSISCIRTRIEYLCSRDPSLNAYRKSIRHVWSESEDSTLISLVNDYGEDWNKIARKMKRFDRNAQQCRTRWRDQLSVTAQYTANNRKHHWSEEEDCALLNGYRIYGKQWAKINQLVPTKGYHDVRNRINSLAMKAKIEAIDSSRQ